MHRAILTTITTIPVLLLAATVAISVMVSEDAFARDGGRYSGDSTSQAAAVDNSCLNPILDSNTIDNVIGVANCGGTGSQQDESGQASAPITHQTANPTIELQRATTSTPPPGVGDPQADCEACFQPVVDNELQGGFLDALHSLDQNFANANTIEEVCMVLLGQNMNQLQTSINNIEGALDTLNLDGETIDGIVDCLKSVFGIP
ncbi:MAG: hypothetical protein WCF07_01440 [Nitrososphaeraceae archaeon]